MAVVKKREKLTLSGESKLVSEIYRLLDTVFIFGKNRGKFILNPEF